MFCLENSYISLLNDAEIGDEKDYAEHEERFKVFDDTDDLEGKWMSLPRIYSHFPCPDEFLDNANLLLRQIKTGIAESVILGKPCSSLRFWIKKIHKYVQVYPKCFCKEDYIKIVNFLYECLTTEWKEFNDISLFKMSGDVLIRMLQRNYLSRDDISFDWRKLYTVIRKKIYAERKLYYLSYIDDHKVLFCCKMVFACVRKFFTKESTKEILEELHPNMNTSSLHTDLFYFCMFFPCLDDEFQEKYGAGLWFEQIWSLFMKNINSWNYPSLQLEFIRIFSRLAEENPAFINWSDKYDIIMTMLLNYLSPKIFSDRNFVSEHEEFLENTFAKWVAYMLGGHDNGIQDHLSILLSAIKNYLHPSCNSNDAKNIMIFLGKLVRKVCSRLKRERHKKSQFLPQIPVEKHLTDKQLEIFVDSILPCALFLLFSKNEKGRKIANDMLHCMSFMAPGIIIPSVLHLVYTRIDRIDEPYDTLQSLTALEGILLPLVQDDQVLSDRMRKKTGELCIDNSLSYRIHVIKLLEIAIPLLNYHSLEMAEVGQNIMAKILLLVPLVDRSDAVHSRNDLSKEQQEFCSLTANFSVIAVKLMSTLIAVIKDLDNTGLFTDTLEYTLETDENKKASFIPRVFLSFILNCSTSIFKVAIEEFYEFISEVIVLSPAATKVVIDMFIIIFRIHTNECDRFFDFFFKKVESVESEVYNDLKPDASLIWYVDLVTAFFYTNGSYILEHKEKYIKLLQLLNRFKCKRISKVTCNALCVMLKVLSLVQIDFPEIHAKFVSRNPGEFTSIRNWMETEERKDVIIFRLPPKEGRILVEELLERFLYPVFDEVEENIDSLSRNDLLLAANKMKCLTEYSFHFPYIHGEVAKIDETPASYSHFDIESCPSNLRNFEKDGLNIREYVLERLARVVNILFEKREDEPDVLIILCKAMYLSLSIKNPNLSYTLGLHEIPRLKNPIIGSALDVNITYVKYVVTAYIMNNDSFFIGCMADKFVKHLKLLLKFAFSRYAIVSRYGLTLFSYIFRNVYLSHLFALDDILVFRGKVSSDIFENALKLLNIGGKQAIFIKQHWFTLNQVWPSLLEAETEVLEDKTMLQLAKSRMKDFLNFNPNAKFSKELIELARKFYEGDSSHPLLRPMPSEDEIEIAMKQQNEYCTNELKSHHDLIDKLVSILSRRNLNQVNSSLGYVALNHFIRLDTTYSIRVLQFSVKSLIHDSALNREISLNILTAWLQANKVECVKIPLERMKIDLEPENDFGWITSAGYRKDNLFLLHDCEQDYTKDVWDKSVCLVKKKFSGYRMWPKTSFMCAPASEQKKSNRSFDELNEFEIYFLNAFNDEDFLEKFARFFSLSVLDLSDHVLLNFFYFLLRNFNIMILPAFKKIVEHVVKNRKQSKDYLIASVVVGSIKGGKYWVFENLNELQEWLTSVVMDSLYNMESSCFSYWVEVLCTDEYFNDPRIHYWFIKLLFELANKDAHDSYRLSRWLEMLRKLVKTDYRWIESKNELYNLCLSLMAHRCENIRQEVACNFKYYLLQNMNLCITDPTLEKKFKPILLDDFLKDINPKIEILWREVSCAKDSDQSELMVENKTEREKALLVFETLTLAMKTFGGLIPFQPSLFNILPLFFHFANNCSDEELKQNCVYVSELVLSRCIVTENDLEMILAGMKELMSSVSSWWKCKIAVLKYLQVNVYTNLYVFSRKQDDIQSLLTSAIHDQRLEIRNTAANTFSNFLKCSFLKVDNILIERFKSWCKEDDKSIRHGGVLGLVALVLAFPYDVPSFIPDILMTLCDHLLDREPIRSTVENALNCFKKTHQDNWHNCKKCFSEYELSRIENALTSPRFYV